MTKALNRLPAILLAVIIAAAVALAMGFAQPSYAADDDYFVLITPVNDNYVGLPESDMDVEATIYDNQGNDVTGQIVPQDIEWTISSGTAFSSWMCFPPVHCTRGASHIRGHTSLLPRHWHCRCVP